MFAFCLFVDVFYIFFSDYTCRAYHTDLYHSPHTDSQESVSTKWKPDIDGL